MSTRAEEPAGAGKPQRVDEEWVYGCRDCLRLEGALHAPTCPIYGRRRHAKEHGRKVLLGECAKFRAAVDPRPARRKA